VEGTKQVQKLIICAMICTGRREDGEADLEGHLALILVRFREEA
jgi:hypothetical protein